MFCEFPQSICMGGAYNLLHIVIGIGSRGENIRQSV